MVDDDRYDIGGNGAGFVMGLVAGTVLGAGLGMLLAPKAGADLRGQIGQQARELGNRASEQYRRASQTATDWAERGRQVMNQARDAVSRGAEEARDYADGYTGTTTGGTYTGGTAQSGTDYGRS